MRRYTKQELRHLKYELIHRDGLTPEEATARIRDMLRFTDEQHKKTKIKGSLTKNKG